jgi:transcriptional regulator with XRE-family HTH domain
MIAPPSAAAFAATREGEEQQPVIDEAFGALIRRYRIERSLRQTDLGRRIAEQARADGIPLPPVSRHTVSRWESGHPPTDLYAVLLARVLNVPVADLGEFVGRHLAPDRVEEIIGRAARSQAAAGLYWPSGDARDEAMRHGLAHLHSAHAGLTLDWERLGSVLVATQRVDDAALRDLELLTHVLTQQLPHLAPRTLLPQLCSHLIILRNKLLTTNRDRVKRELAVLAGRTAIAAGVEWHAMDDLGEAREAYNFGLELSHEMNDPDLKAVALMSKALLATRGQNDRGRRPAEAEEGLPAERGWALQLMNEAYRLLRSGPPAMRAWTLLGRAFEHACWGDDARSMEDLDLTERAMAQTDGASRFLLLFDPEVELLLYRGKCSARLGRLREGSQVLEDAIAGQRYKSVSMRTWLTVDLASVVLEGGGEVDRAAGLLAGVWDDVCHQGVTIFQRRIHRFAYRDLAPYQGVKEVRMLRESIAAERESGWGLSL